MNYGNAFNLGDVELDGGGEEFPSIFEFMIPVTDGLEGVFFLAPDADISYNAATATPATVVGAPTPTDIGHRFNVNNYINTGIAEAPEMTLIAIGRDPTGTGDTGPGFVGNLSNVANGGIAIYGVGNLLVGGNASRGASGSASQVSGSNLGNPTLIAYRAYSDERRNRLQDLTTGGSVENVNVQPRTLNTSTPILVGRGGFTGESELLVAVIFSRALSDAELAEMAEWARGYAAAHDVTV